MAPEGGKLHDSGILVPFTRHLRDIRVKLRVFLPKV